MLFQWYSDCSSLAIREMRIREKEIPDTDLLKAVVLGEAAFLMGEKLWKGHHSVDYSLIFCNILSFRSGVRIRVLLFCFGILVVFWKKQPKVFHMTAFCVKKIVETCKPEKGLSLSSLIAVCKPTFCSEAIANYSCMKLAEYRSSCFNSRLRPPVRLYSST